MSDRTSPRSVFRSLLQGISDGRWDELADLYAEDAVVEMPFTPTPPARLEGREAIRAHFAAAARGPLTLQASNVVVHDSDDPEVVIAEFDYDGQVSTTGRSFRASNIQVLRVRNGRIVSSRDYHDHLAIAVALGQVQELRASRTEMTPQDQIPAELATAGGSSPQLHPLVVPQDSQTKQEPAGRMRTPQVEQ